MGNEWVHACRILVCSAAELSPIPSQGSENQAYLIKFQGENYGKVMARVTMVNISGLDTCIYTCVYVVMILVVHC